MVGTLKPAECPALCIAHFSEQPPQCPLHLLGHLLTLRLPLLCFYSCGHSCLWYPSSLSPRLFHPWNWILHYRPSQGTFSQADFSAMYDSQISRTTIHAWGTFSSHHIQSTGGGGGGVALWQTGLQRLLPPPWIGIPQVPCPTSRLECQGLSLTCESPGNGSGAGTLMSRTRPEPRCSMLDERERERAGEDRG